MIDERYPNVARVVDHINPVNPAMSDAESYDRGNLRAACVMHNVARGFERFERQHAGRSAAVAAGVDPRAGARRRGNPTRFWLVH